MKRCSFIYIHIFIVYLLHISCNYLHCWYLFIIWAAAQQNNQMTCVLSKDTDQLRHLPSLIRVFAVCMKEHWVLGCPSSAQQILWSDWVDAQADLSLRWVHRSFCWFCHAVAHFQFEACSVVFFLHFFFLSPVIWMFDPLGCSEDFFAMLCAPVSQHWGERMGVHCYCQSSNLISKVIVKKWPL